MFFFWAGKKSTLVNHRSKKFLWKRCSRSQQLKWVMLQNNSVYKSAESFQAMVHEDPLI